MRTKMANSVGHVKTPFQAFPQVAACRFRGTFFPMNEQKATRSTAALVEFAVVCLGVLAGLAGIIISSPWVALLGLVMIVAGVVLLLNRRRTSSTEP
jgi:Flp pilus assembly protein TadB